MSSKQSQVERRWPGHNAALRQKRAGKLVSNIHLDPAVVNEFYSWFWSSDGWGSALPNEDESLRAKAITRMIEEFVMPPDAGAANLRILDLGCGRGWLTSMRPGRILFRAITTS